MDELDGFAVLLVDDHPLFRDGLAAALHHQAAGLRVQAVDSLATAMDTLAEQTKAFDLVLVDYLLPGTDGLRCAAKLMQAYPNLGVGLMSGLEDPTLPSRARAAGLMAYLPKTLEVPALLAHLRCLARGEPVFSEPGLPAPSEARTSPYGLTARQVEVLHLLATGGSNKEIARSIGISPATVKNHLEAIFAKMGATNRLQAVVMARDMLGQLPQ